MLTYKKKDENRTDSPIRVLSEGKVLGTIKTTRSDIGTEPKFQYFPKGSKNGGDVFPTLAECKASLECDDD